MYFLIKNLQKVLWTVLPVFSSCNLQYRVSFFLYYGKLSHSFLSLEWLPTFYPLYFQCHEISLRVPLICQFFLASLLLEHHRLFIIPLYVNKFAFTQFLWLHMQSLQWLHCQLPRSALCPTTSFMFNLNSSFSIITFFFFTALPFWWSLLSFDYPLL